MSGDNFTGTHLDTVQDETCPCDQYSAKPVGQCTMNFYLGLARHFIFLAYFLIFLLHKSLLGINIDVIWLIIDFWSFPRPVVANLEAQNPQNSS